MFRALSLTLCLVAGPAFHAAAQAVAVPLKLTLKTVTQDVDGLELKAGKETFNQKDVFQSCIGSPESGQVLAVAIDCGASEDGSIRGFDKTDGSVTPSSLGTLDFDYTNSVSTTKNGSPKSRVIPFILSIDCGQFLLFTAGVADVTYKTVDGEQGCPSTIKGKIVGVGEVDPIGNVIVDEGSSFSASGPILLAP